MARKGTFSLGDIVHVVGNSTPLEVVGFGIKYGEPGTLKLRYVNSNRIKKELIHYSALKFYSKPKSNVSF